MTASSFEDGDERAGMIKANTAEVVSYQPPTTKSLNAYARRITAKAKRLIGRAAAAPLTWMGAETRAEALENLTERMQVTIETPRGSIRYYAPTPLLLARGKNMLLKEMDTIRWIDGFPGSCVFWDVGANVGVYSLYAATKRGVSVLSFEPLAANFHALSRNVELNRLGEQITGYCLALSGATELGVLNMDSSAMGSALSQFGRPGEISRYCTRKEDSGCTHGMIGYSVDDFINQFHPSFPNYIKMDVDGLEWKILQGARKTVCDSRLRSLLVELTLSDQREHDLAVAFLGDFGFGLVSVGDVQGTEAGKAANHLFERRSDASR